VRATTAAAGDRRLERVRHALESAIATAAPHRHADTIRAVTSFPSSEATLNHPGLTIWVTTDNLVEHMLHT
jgi:hypothetical protein